MHENTTTACHKPLRRSDMARFVFVLVFLILVSWGLPMRSERVPSALAASITPTIEVAYRERQLTVNAQHVPVTAILRVIADRVGFETVIYGELNSRPITRSFVARPVAEVLHNLLEGQSWAMRYNASQDDGATLGTAKLWVYASAYAGAPSQIAEDVEFQRVAPVAQFEVVPEAVADGNASEIDLQAQVLVQGRDASQRSEAVFALEHIGGEEAARALEAGLGDLNATVRIDVIEALERLQADRALPAFGQVLYSDPDPKVRLAAVQAIARQHSEPVLGFLKFAAKDKDKTVREAARRALVLWQ